MSIIASPYNTGTGLLTAVTNEGTLPIVVDDLTVNGNLTVIGTTTLKDEATAEGDFIVLQTTTTENLIVNNNSILNNGVGQNNSALFKLPLTNGTNNQVLTILDQTLVPISTTWQSPIIISNYVQYDTAQTKLKNNISGVVSDIDKIVINGSIGKTATEDFVLPTNTTTAINGTTLAILDATASPKTTSWIVPAPPISNYMQYNTTTFNMSNNVSGTPTIINNLAIPAIGSSLLQMFALPTNTSTVLNNSILSINSSTKFTSWTSDYLKYNSTTTAIENNVTGSGVAISDLQLTTIGQSGQKFQLPNNTSTTSNGQILSILNATTKTTQWIAPPPTIIDYMQYNTATFKMSTNVSGTPTIITDIVVSNTVGSAKTQAFQLPANTSTASNGDVLRILNNVSVPITTEWANTSTVLPAFVSYDATTTELSNNPLIGLPSVITNLIITNIGRINNNFNLPTNTSTATPYSRLVLIDNATRATTWYPSNGNVGYNTTTKVLTTENSAGAIPDITDIAVTKIGSTNAQLFLLPTNTSTATLGNVLTISNATTKATSWAAAPFIPTTVTSTGTSIATANAATVEMCRASNLVAGTYIVTYQLELLLSLSARVFSYRSYGIATTVSGLVGNPVLGLVVGDSVPYTAPTMLPANPVRYSGGGVVVLTATTTLYLLTRFNYTGTTFSTTGNLIVTRIA